MSQLDPSRYKQFSSNSQFYGVSYGLYWDTTNSQLCLAINDAIVARVDATGITADFEFSGEARGDMLRRGASVWEKHSAKASGQVLIGDGTDIKSTAISGDVAITGGGAATVTGLTLGSDARGDIVRRNAASWGRLAAKTLNQFLVGDGTDIISTALINSMLAKPRVRCITEALLASALVDGGAAVGTKTMATAIPAGARYLYTTIDTIIGFAGNVSAVIQVGDGSTVARYNTGTPNIFATAAAGVDMGVPSGTAFHATAVAGIVATVTSSTDITPVLAGGGSANLNFWFLEPI